jgi:ABC-2 type transport system permease protein
MRVTTAIFRRELKGYFATPVAYVFLIIFLLLTGVFTFSSDLGNFFGRGQADLVSFFGFHPWLYMLLVPAISMRLWSEERSTGTIEMLMTLPVSMGQAVMGKFLAAWAFTGIALVGTAPVWITVNYLGNPDNGVILAGYIGSMLMAGAYLAVGACISAFTKNQVIAFVVSVMVLLMLTMAGWPTVLDALPEAVPQIVVETVASLSFYSHFQAIIRGVLDLRDVLFFVSFMALWLFANAVVIERRKAN